MLMSAKGDQVGERFVKVMGIVDYITKPFSPEAITAVVQHYDLRSTPRTPASSNEPLDPAAPTKSKSDAAADGESPRSGGSYSRSTRTSSRDLRQQHQRTSWATRIAALVLAGRRRSAPMMTDGDDQRAHGRRRDRRRRPSLRAGRRNTLRKRSSPEAEPGYSSPLRCAATSASCRSPRSCSCSTFRSSRARFRCTRGNGTIEIYFRKGRIDLARRHRMSPTSSCSAGSSSRTSS